MQTSHLPDPYDPAPVKNGITVYYTDMLYGHVRFAILEDRTWKTGPRGLVETEPGKPADWVVDPDFDPQAADVPDVELLGARELAFLDDWAADWRGADMKCVVSQNSLAQLPTHHGHRLRCLVVDLDSNGWPQTPRDEALLRFRKGFALHLGGDQHLSMLLRYGIVRFHNPPREITMEAWPVLSDPRRDDAQYAGWPKTVHMLDNYAREATAYLPTIEVSGAENPMVQASGEVVYTLRIQGQSFRPKVFREGTYTVHVGDDGAWRETLEGLTASSEEATTREVRL